MSVTVAGRGASGMATDTLAATMKVYNAAMGDRLADPDALIHHLRPNALMRIIGPRWEANAGNRSSDGADHAAYDYEGLHGIVGRISHSRKLCVIPDNQT